MLFLALSAAAGLIVGPEPDLRRVSPDNFLTDMLRANKSVSAEVEAIISPEGEIESCALKSFVGDEQFAKRICSLFDKRTWAKSLDAQGHAVYGRIRTVMRFTIPGTKEGEEAQRTKQSPDLELPFPADWRGEDEVIIPLAVLVGEDGRAQACNLQATRWTDKHAKDLADLACEGLGSKTYSPIATRVGSVQRYVVAQRVRFSRSGS
ncbi:MAG: hypothetical protein ACXWJC_05960 [Croceibacterium sp.]